MHSRRALLRTGALLGTAGWLPRPARAASASELKFVFVFAPGGWDPTRVYADAFDADHVDLEPTAERGTAGNIGFVDHADRPSVRAFFEAHHARTLVLNGLMVRSIAHEICTMIAMTGTTSGLTPDWPAILAGQDRSRYQLPHLVLGGPSFPGNLGVAVSRTGSAGQLEALLSGRVPADLGSSGPNKPAEALLDRYLLRRTAAKAAGATSAIERRLAEELDASVNYATDLKDLQWVMDFTGGTRVVDQAEVAVDALTLGVSRCVTLAATSGQLGWDTHANNDALQSPLWESLFSGLGLLLTMLQSTPGTSAATLADETVVVVLSEMGRTPQINAFAGKDHWPYTSAMLVGPNLIGDRVIGAFDANFYGKTIDPASGDLSETGVILSAESLGATLLAMADIDPFEFVDGVEPLLGVLA